MGEPFRFRQAVAADIPAIAQLHVDTFIDPDITAVYDRHSYDPEKRSALEWWAAQLMSIVENADGAKVLSFIKSA